MNKFFVMTRGRTGSTAVVDVLSKISSVHIPREQEVFLQYGFPAILKNFPDLKNYPSTLPFVLWEKNLSGWMRFRRRLSQENKLIKWYLEDAERLAFSKNAGAFGFKVLSNHFSENPQLKDALRAHGYRAIYLTRNVARQVISGMIAKKRGRYNSKANFQDESRYRIDIEEFESLVQWEARAVESDIAFLSQAGFEFIEVTYEEFKGNRKVFFDKVLEFIGVPFEMPKESCYSVMIKDLRHTVENYQAVVDCATSMGMSVE